MSIKIYKNKYLVILLVITILFTNSVPAHAYGSRTLFKSRSHAQRYLEDSEKEPTQADQVLSLLNLPEKIATVQDFYRGSTDSLVVHIQDRHADPVAQLNIAEIVKELNLKQNIHLMCLEGASGELNTDFYDSIEETSSKAEVAEFFVKKGLFTGAEFYKIANKQSYLKAVGAEERGLYLEHLACYQKQQVDKEHILKLLKTLESRLAGLRQRLYSEALRRLDKNILLYKQKAVSLKEYLEIITRYAKSKSIDISKHSNLTQFLDLVKKENSLDFSKADKERKKLINHLSEVLNETDSRELINKSLGFRMGEVSDIEFYAYLESLLNEHAKELAVKECQNLVSYIEYLRLSKTISHLRVFEEAEELEDETVYAFCQNQTQKRLASYSKALGILKELFDLKLIPRYLEYMENHPEHFDIANIAAFTEKASKACGLDGNLPISLSHIDKDAIKASKEFYEIALRRDAALIENTLKGMHDYRKDKAILVTGGFHTKGITNILKEKNISYVVICPRISTNDCQKVYEDRIAGKMPEVAELAEFFTQTLGASLLTADPEDMPKAKELISYARRAFATLVNGNSIFKRLDTTQRQLFRDNRSAILASIIEALQKQSVVTLEEAKAICMEQIGEAKASSSGKLELIEAADSREIQKARRLADIADYLEEHALEGSILYIDIDDTMIEPVYNYPSSGFIMARAQMIEKSLAHVNNREGRKTLRADKKALDEYYDIEEGYEGLYRITDGLERVMAVCKQKNIRVIAITNRADGQRVKPVTEATLAKTGIRIGTDIDELLCCEYGPYKKAQRFLRHIRGRAPPPVAYFIDNSRKEVNEVFQTAAKLEGVRSVAIHLDQPSRARYRSYRFYLDAIDKLQPSGDTESDINNLEILLINAIITLSTDTSLSKAEKLDKLNRILDIIESNELNKRDHIVRSYIYQYLYETIESLLDVDVVFSHDPSTEPIPLELSIYFRIVFPFNYRNAIACYMHKDRMLNFRTPSDRLPARLFGAQAQVSINQDNLYLFLEPILRKIAENKPDRIVLMDSGARPYLPVLEDFIARHSPNTRILCLPFSVHDAYEGKKHITHRLEIGRAYFQTYSKTNDEQAALEAAKELIRARKEAFAQNLLSHDRLLEKVAKFYAQFFPLDSNTSILIFDDNIDTGSTVLQAKEALVYNGAALENCSVAAPLLLSKKADEKVDAFTSFFSGHTNWSTSPAKISFYPVWEEDFKLRGVKKRRKATSHLTIESDGSAMAYAAVFRRSCVEKFNRDMARFWHSQESIPAENDTASLAKTSSAGAKIGRENGWTLLKEQPDAIPKTWEETLKYKQKKQADFTLSATDLILVHRTNYLPEQGKIKTLRHATGGEERARDSVHFCLNHAVSSHIGGRAATKDGEGWDSMPYTILIPLHLVPKDSVESIFAVDTYLLGDVELPEGSVVLVSNGSPVPTASSLGKARHIELEDNSKSSVERTIASLGYTLADGGQESSDIDDYVYAFGKEEAIPYIGVIGGATYRYDFERLKIVRKAPQKILEELNEESESIFNILLESQKSPETRRATFRTEQEELEVAIKRYEAIVGESVYIGGAEETELQELAWRITSIPALFNLLIRARNFISPKYANLQTTGGVELRNYHHYQEARDEVVGKLKELFLYAGLDEELYISQAGQAELKDLAKELAGAIATAKASSAGTQDKGFAASVGKAAKKAGYSIGAMTISIAYLATIGVAGWLVSKEKLAADLLPGGREGGRYLNYMMDQVASGGAFANYALLGLAIGYLVSNLSLELKAHSEERRSLPKRLFNAVKRSLTSILFLENITSGKLPNILQMLGIAAWTFLIWSWFVVNLSISSISIAAWGPLSFILLVQQIMAHRRAVYENIDDIIDREYPGVVEDLVFVSVKGEYEIEFTDGEIVETTTLKQAAFEVKKRWSSLSKEEQATLKREAQINALRDRINKKHPGFVAEIEGSSQNPKAVSIVFSDDTAIRNVPIKDAEALVDAHVEAYYTRQAEVTEINRAGLEALEAVTDEINRRAVADGRETPIKYVLAKNQEVGTCVIYFHDSTKLGYEDGEGIPFEEAEAAIREHLAKSSSAGGPKELWTKAKGRLAERWRRKMLEKYDITEEEAAQSSSAAAAIGEAGYDVIGGMKSEQSITPGILSAYSRLRAVAGTGIMAGSADQVYDPVNEDLSISWLEDSIGRGWIREVVERAVSHNERRINILVFGAGTGIDALAAIYQVKKELSRLAEDKGVDVSAFSIKVDAVDIDQAAVEITEFNVGRFAKDSVSENDDINIFKVEKGNEFESCQGPYHLAFFNVPNIVEDADAVAHHATHITFNQFSLIAEQIIKRLSPIGNFLFCSNDKAKKVIRQQAAEGSSILLDFKEFGYDVDRHTAWGTMAERRVFHKVYFDQQRGTRARGRLALDSLMSEEMDHRVEMAAGDFLSGIERMASKATVPYPSSYVDIIENSIPIIAKAHSEQKRLDERRAYFLHPIAVAEALAQRAGILDPTLILIALLHDTLEDQPDKYERTMHSIHALLLENLPNKEAEEWMKRMRYGVNVLSQREDESLKDYCRRIIDAEASQEEQILVEPEFIMGLHLIKIFDIEHNCHDIKNSLRKDTIQKPEVAGFPKHYIVEMVIGEFVPEFIEHLDAGLRNLFYTDIDAILKDLILTSGLPERMEIAYPIMQAAKEAQGKLRDMGKIKSSSAGSALAEVLKEVAEIDIGSQVGETASIEVPTRYRRTTERMPQLIELMGVIKGEMRTSVEANLGIEFPIDVIGLSDLVGNSIDAVMERLDYKHDRLGEEEAFWFDGSGSVSFRVYRNEADETVNLVISNDGPGIPLDLVDGWVKGEFRSTKTDKNPEDAPIYFGSKGQGIRNLLGEAELKGYTVTLITCQEGEQSGIAFHQDVNGERKLVTDIAKSEHGTDFILTVPISKATPKTKKASSAGLHGPVAKMAEQLKTLSTDAATRLFFVGKEGDFLYIQNMAENVWHAIRTRKGAVLKYYPGSCVREQIKVVESISADPFALNQGGYVERSTRLQLLSKSLTLEDIAWGATHESPSGEYLRNLNLILTSQAWQGRWGRLITDLSQRIKKARSQTDAPLDMQSLAHDIDDYLSSINIDLEDEKDEIGFTMAMGLFAEIILVDFVQHFDPLLSDKEIDQMLNMVLKILEIRINSQTAANFVPEANKLNILITPNASFALVAALMHEALHAICKKSKSHKDIRWLQSSAVQEWAEQAYDLRLHPAAGDVEQKDTPLNTALSCRHAFLQNNKIEETEITNWQELVRRIEAIRFNNNRDVEWSSGAYLDGKTFGSYAFKFYGKEAGAFLIRLYADYGKKMNIGQMELAAEAYRVLLQDKTFQEKLATLAQASNANFSYMRIHAGLQEALISKARETDITEHDRYEKIQQEAENLAAAIAEDAQLMQTIGKKSSSAGRVLAETLEAVSGQDIGTQAGETISIRVPASYRRTTERMPQLIKIMGDIKQAMRRSTETNLGIEFPLDLIGLSDLVGNSIDAVMERLDYEHDRLAEEEAFWFDGSGVVSFRVYINEADKTVNLAISNDGPGIPVDLVDDWVKGEFRSTKTDKNPEDAPIYFGSKGQGIRNLLGEAELKGYAITLITCQEGQERGIAFHQSVNGARKAVTNIAKSEHGTDFIITIPMSNVTPVVEKASSAGNDLVQIKELSLATSRLLTEGSQERAIEILSDAQRQLGLLQGEQAITAPSVDTINISQMALIVSDLMQAEAYEQLVPLLQKAKDLLEILQGHDSSPADFASSQGLSNVVAERKLLGAVAHAMVAVTRNIITQKQADSNLVVPAEITLLLNRMDSVADALLETSTQDAALGPRIAEIAKLRTEMLQARTDIAETGSRLKDTGTRKSSSAGTDSYDLAKQMYPKQEAGDLRTTASTETVHIVDAFEFILNRLPTVDEATDVMNEVRAQLLADTGEDVEISEIATKHAITIRTANNYIETLKRLYSGDHNPDSFRDRRDTGYDRDLDSLIMLLVHLGLGHDAIIAEIKRIWGLAGISQEIQEEEIDACERIVADTIARASGLPLPGELARTIALALESSAYDKNRKPSSAGDVRSAIEAFVNDPSKNTKTFAAFKYLTVFGDGIDSPGPTAEESDTIADEFAEFANSFPIEAYIEYTVESGFDTSAIQAVLHELLANAYDAIVSFYDLKISPDGPPEGYKPLIRVACEIRQIDAEFYLIITVHDNGMGEDGAKTKRKRELLDAEQYFYIGGIGESRANANSLLDNVGGWLEDDFGTKETRNTEVRLMVPMKSLEMKSRSKASSAGKKTDFYITDAETAGSVVSVGEFVVSMFNQEYGKYNPNAGYPDRFGMILESVGYIGDQDREILRLATQKGKTGKSKFFILVGSDEVRESLLTQCDFLRDSNIQTVDEYIGYTETETGKVPLEIRIAEASRVMRRDVGSQPIAIVSNSSHFSNLVSGHLESTDTNTFIICHELSDARYENIMLGKETIPANQAMLLRLVFAQFMDIISDPSQFDIINIIPAITSELFSEKVSDLHQAREAIAAAA